MSRAISLFDFADFPVHTYKKECSINQYTEDTSSSMSIDSLRIEAKIHSIKEVIVEEKTVKEYRRNQYISLYAKCWANGICQLCSEPAPFYDSNGDAFLESHHIIPLSEGGKDSIENVIALCPNCHRKMHILRLTDDVEKLRARARDISENGHNI